MYILINLYVLPNFWTKLTENYWRGRCERTERLGYTEQQWQNSTNFSMLICGSAGHTDRTLLISFLHLDSTDFFHILRPNTGSANSLLEKGQGTGNCCAVFEITIRELQLENQSKVCPGAGREGRHPDPHAGIKPVWAARIASARDSVRSYASGLLLKDHFNASRVSTNVSPGIRMRFRTNV